MQNGALAIYYGNGKSWTKLEDKYAKDAVWGVYKGAAFNHEDDFGFEFIFDFENSGKIAVNGGYEFYDKPRHNAGKKFVKE